MTLQIIEARLYSDIRRSSTKS